MFGLFWLKFFNQFEEKTNLNFRTHAHWNLEDLVFYGFFCNPILSNSVFMLLINRSLTKKPMNSNIISSNLGFKFEKLWLNDIGEGFAGLYPLLG